MTTVMHSANDVFAAPGMPYAYGYGPSVQPWGNETYASSYESDFPVMGADTNVYDHFVSRSHLVPQGIPLSVAGQVYPNHHTPRPYVSNYGVCSAQPASMAEHLALLHSKNAYALSRGVSEIADASSSNFIKLESWACSTPTHELISTSVGVTPTIPPGVVILRPLALTVASLHVPESRVHQTLHQHDLISFSYWSRYSSGIYKSRFGSITKLPNLEVTRPGCVVLDHCWPVDIPVAVNVRTVHEPKAKAAGFWQHEKRVKHDKRVKRKRRAARAKFTQRLAFFREEDIPQIEAQAGDGIEPFAQRVTNTVKVFTVVTYRVLTSILSNVAVSVMASVVVACLCKLVTEASVAIGLYRRAVSAVDSILTSFENMRDVIRRLDLTRITPEQKLVLVEVYEVIRAAYHLYHGQNGVAMGCLGALVFTRLDTISQAVTSALNSSTAGFRNLFDGGAGAEVGNRYYTRRDYAARAARDDQRVAGVMAARATAAPANPARPPAAAQVNQDRGPPDGPVPMDMPPEVAAAAAENDELVIDGSVLDMMGLIPCIAAVMGLTEEEVRGINNQFTFVNHGRKLWGECVDMVKLIVSVLSRSLFGVDFFESAQQEYVEQVVGAIEFVDNFKLNAVHELSKTVVQDLVKKKYAESTALSIHVRCNSLPLVLRQRFLNSHAELAGFAEKATALSLNVVYRRRPTSVLFTGPPKVGKSACVGLLTSAIASTQGYPKDSSLMFVQNFATEYWDGYQNQPFVLLDDIWRTTDVTRRMAENDSIISCVNNAPYLPNMAFDKGKFAFTSEFVFATTNLMNRGIKYFSGTDCTGMTDFSAVTRRFHIVVHRSTKVESDVIDNEWRIDQCEEFPEMEGCYVNTRGLYELIMDSRRKSGESDARYNYTDEQITEFLSSESIKVDAMPKPQKHHRSGGTEVKDLAVSVDSPSTIDCVGLFHRIVRLGVFNDHPWLPYLGTLFAVLSGAIGIKLLYDFMNPAVRTDSPDDTVGAYTVKTRGYRKAAGREARPGGRRMGPRVPDLHQVSGPMNLHGSVDNYVSNLANLLSKTMFVVGASRPPSVSEPMLSTNCQAIHIKDGYAITCAHWFVNYADRPGVKMFIRRGPNDEDVITAPFPTSEQWVMYTDDDVAMFKMPNMPPMRESYKYFCGEDNYPLVRIGDVLNLLYLEHIEGAPNPIGSAVTKAVYASSGNAHHGVEYKSGGNRFVLDEPIAYATTSRRGDSGSMLVMCGDMGKPLILGHHVGKRATIGIAVPISKDYLDDMLSELGVEVQSSDNFAMVVPRPPAVSIDVSKFFPTFVRDEHFSDTLGIPCIGKLPPHLSSSFNGKTAIKRSELHRWCGEETFAPARQRAFKKGDAWVDPRAVALRKVTFQPFKIEPITDLTRNYVKRLYPRVVATDDILCRVLTRAEAISGIPECGIKSVKMSASSGFPFNKYTSLPGKSAYLDRGPNDEPVSTPLFDAIMDEFDRRLATGEDLCVFWDDKLKDETRPLDKVEAGKTRLISACALHFLVSTRQYFGAYVAYTSRTPWSKPISIGIDMHSTMSAALRERLSTHGGSIISGDYSSFDATIPPELVEEYVEIVNWWYDDGPTNAAIRRRLVSYLTHATHVIMNEIYQAKGGHPSGDPLTGNLNSIVAIMSLHSVYTGDFKQDDTTFEMTVHGDDNVTDLLEEGITCDMVAPHLKRRYNMDYTHWSKDASDLNKPDSIDDIRYLGRLLHKSGRAPLDIRVVVEMLYWVRGDVPARQAISTTLDTFFIELSHFSREEYDHYFDLLRASTPCQRDPTLRSLVESKNLGYDYYQARKYNPEPGFPRLCPYSYSTGMIGEDWDFEAHSSVNGSFPFLTQRSRQAPMVLGDLFPLGATDNDLYRNNGQDRLETLSLVVPTRNWTVDEWNFNSQYTFDTPLSDMAAALMFPQIELTMTRFGAIFGLLGPIYCAHYVPRLSDHLDRPEIADLTRIYLHNELTSCFDDDGSSGAPPMTIGSCIKRTLERTFRNLSLTDLSTVVPDACPNWRIFILDNLSARATVLEDNVYRAILLRMAPRQGEFDTTLRVISDEYGRGLAGFVRTHMRTYAFTHMLEPIYQNGVPVRVIDYVWSRLLEIHFPDRPSSPTAVFEIHSSSATPGALFSANDRNTEFTDRATNDPTVGQETQLGDIHDVAPITSTAVDAVIKQPALSDFNMERYNLNGAVDRYYELDTLSWTTAQGVGTILATYNFPDVLFAKTFIADKIKDFRYFRGGVRFTIRVVTNQFLYGKLIVCYYPRASDEQHPPTTTYRASGYPHVLVSSAAGDAVVYDIPFIYPFRVLDINNYQPGDMGAVRVMVLNPLTAVTTAVSSAKVFIGAQFLGSEVMFPHFSPTDGETSSGMFDGVEFEPHASAALTIAGAAMGEALAKTAVGSISNSLERGAVGVAKVGVAALESGIKDTINGGIKAVRRMIGLSKPPTMDATQVVKINPYFDNMSGRGISYVPNSGVDPECGISVDPVVGGITTDEMDIHQLLGTPSMVTRHAFTDATAPQAICVCGPYDANDTICDLATRLFCYRSGSYNIKVYITSSQFHSVRGVFWLTDSAASTDDWETCYYKVVDIQGDTEVSFSIPYCEKEVMAPVEVATTFGIWFKVISWSVPDSALNVPIYLNTYKACASDFIVSGPKEVAFVADHNPRGDFTKLFPTFHDKMTGYTHKGVVIGENVSSVRELIHRFIPYDETAGSTVRNRWCVPAANTYIGIEAYGMFYRFWRGSVRYRILNADTRFVQMACVHSTNGATTPLQGMAITSPVNPCLELSIPFYSKHMFLETAVAEDSYRAFTDAYTYNPPSNTPKFVFKAGGDDMSFHFIRIPPEGNWSIPSSGFGTQAAFTFQAAYPPTLTKTYV